MEYDSGTTVFVPCVIGYTFFEMKICGNIRWNQEQIT